jgi:Ca2+-binding EF-hand superfamily protein
MYKDLYNTINNNSSINKRNNKISSLPKNIFKKTNSLNSNYNNSKNTSSYFIESSQKNNNFKIIQLNNKNSNINLKKVESNNKNKSSSLYHLLEDYIKQDNSIEMTRQLLSTRDDVNLEDLFKLFNHSSSNNIITSKDFIQTLKEFGLFLNIGDLKFLFRKYNKNINGYFDYEEFCEIILPKKYSSAKIMSEKHRDGSPTLSLETKKILCKLFNNIIEGEKSNDNYRKLIGIIEGQSEFDLYNAIKKNYSIGIYKEDIANFMKKNNHPLSNGEIEMLMERFDKNKDGMIDYKEFVNEITPIN